AKTLRGSSRSGTAVGGRCRFGRPVRALPARGSGRCRGLARSCERWAAAKRSRGDVPRALAGAGLERAPTSSRISPDPDGRAVMGNSSGGSAALIMAWFRTDLYHRVLTTSGTFVNQAWPFDPKYPDGAWGFHETLIPKEPKKPIRIFISVGDKDLLNPNVMRDGMHDWVEANHRMAKVLKEKGYEYQYLFCRASGHSVGNARQQFLPHAIEWVWQGYAAKKDQ